jgi:prepilin-type processing-associated H-X9-DG protein
MMLCPTATKSEGQGAGTTFTAWETPEGDIGSYGINGWVTCPEQDNMNLYGPIENYWRNIGQTSRPTYIPLMMDCRQSFACPKETDSPPISEDCELQSSNHMQRLCMNRHNKGINMAFLDGHVEKIGLKELWILKWHRTYDIEGPWTLKGGADPTDWPQWMSKFRDY